uniref:5'-nucleotidase n=1 Tax=Ornithorhynchus anatinus TaxID=9258 RepID=A0A6I8NYZ0_ORNAN
GIPPAAHPPALRRAAAGASWELTLLHTNDLHSRLEPTSVESGKCQGPPRACFGGVARLATQVGRLRQAHPNVLLLDAGDQYQGTIWFTVYKGVEVAHFMNALRYDAMETHEFDNGGGRSLPTSKPGVHWPLASPDSTIRTRSSMWGSEKVGVVGYTSRETPVLSNPGRDLEFEDEITALQPQVDKLKTLGVNKIIALGHSGFEMDKLIAQKVRGVDVVIGGHTNTFLYTGTCARELVWLQLNRNLLSCSLIVAGVCKTRGGCQKGCTYPSLQAPGRGEGRGERESRCWSLESPQPDFTRHLSLRFGHGWERVGPKADPAVPSGDDYFTCCS